MPWAFSWHAQLHVATSSTRVAPQSCVVSQAHWHVAVSNTNPAAQVTFESHTQPHAAVSQRWLAPQPPQSGRHDVVQVARSHR